MLWSIPTVCSEQFECVQILKYQLISVIFKLQNTGNFFLCQGSLQSNK